MVNIPRDIVIFGTKFEAEKTAYMHMQTMRGGGILFAIDNFIEGNFHGMPIYKLEHILNIEEYFIIIAVSAIDTYNKIKELLIKKGLKEFENFVWHYICYKKIVVINANCHGNALQKYLRKSKDFSIKYAIYPVKEIQNNKSKEIDEKLLSVTDVYIHQDIRSDNKYGYKLSDDYIIPRLSHLCKRICIPNLVGFGNGIFQTQTSEVCTVTGDNTYPIFYRDNIIDRAYNEVSVKTIDNIIKYIINYKFCRADVETKFENTLRKLHQRENNWDIKIVNYIEEHYKLEKLFNDCNHPSDLLMIKICEKVAEMLEIDDINNCPNGEKVSFNMGLESFVWAGIANILGITVTENEVRQDDKIHILGDMNELDMKEFIREYIWCFHNDYLM